MPYNGSGSFSILNTFVPGTTILSSAMNANLTDIATGLSTAVLKNGTQILTANIPFGGFGITGLGSLGSAATATVASATTTNVLGAGSLFVSVTGTTTITSLGTGTNQLKIVVFSGILTLTNNAVSLILPGGTNITTAAGDVMVVMSDASSNARVVSYSSASGILWGGVAAGYVTVASATTCDILAAASLKVAISGTTTITSFGSTANRVRIVVATGAFTITHNPTSLILPTGANITTAAGDNFIVLSDSSGNSRVFAYQRASGQPLAGGTAIVSVKQQVFTGSGTYTPSTGMLYCKIMCLGGGGGGGGTATATAGEGGGGGGGAGGIATKLASATDIGASKAVTIGAAGTGATAGNNDGGAGGDTSVGVLCIGKGGAGGSGSAAQSSGAGGAGGVAGTGDATFPGQAGSPSGAGASTTGGVLSGGGGGSPYGSGGTGTRTKGTGRAAAGYGSGGGGGYDNSAGGGSNRAGGVGTAGIVIVEEYCSQ